VFLGLLIAVTFTVDFLLADDHQQQHGKCQAADGTQYNALESRAPRFTYFVLGFLVVRDLEYPARFPVAGVGQERNHQ